MVVVPKPLYEFIPYLCLLAGSAIIVGLGGYTIPLGLLLFAFGSWLWLMRSDYRRINRRWPKDPARRFFLAAAIYELLPFSYMLVGLLVLRLLDHPVRWLSGPLMLLVGAAVLVLRATQRKKTPPIITLRARKAPAVAPKVSLDQAYTHLVFNEHAITEVPPEYHPPSAHCDRCQIVDICDSVKLKPEAVRQIMRLSQTLSPDNAFEVYREAVERIEKRSISDAELRSVLNLLYRYSDLCATWRKTGRLSAL